VWAALVEHHVEEGTDGLIPRLLVKLHVKRADSFPAHRIVMAVGEDGRLAMD
jgi:hypothetical protein